MSTSCSNTLLKSLSKSHKIHVSVQLNSYKLIAIIFERNQILQWNLQDMWPESSYVNASQPAYIGYLIFQCCTKTIKLKISQISLLKLQEIYSSLPLKLRPTGAILLLLCPEKFLTSTAPKCVWWLDLPGSTGGASPDLLDGFKKQGYRSLRGRRERRKATEGREKAEGK